MNEKLIVTGFLLTRSCLSIFSKYGMQSKITNSFSGCIQCTQIYKVIKKLDAICKVLDKIVMWISFRNHKLAGVQRTKLRNPTQ